ncbi:MAG TPA: aminoglycoside phosphotransferase family protein [Blastococcus sp.]|nr:aminoglycoside phosphotransferase family protein [Blastococcus sp.]
MTDTAPRLPLPAALVAAAEAEGRTGWLATLPGTVARLVRDWSLAVEAPFSPGGQTAWVAPVRDYTGAERVLKIAWRHPEAEHEADGLRAWAGHGAVRLCAAESTGDTSALLLERCRPGTPLATTGEPEQDRVVASLLRRLWIAPPAESAFRPLQDMCAQWAEEFAQQGAAHPEGTDPGLAREGMALFRSLPADADRAVLLVTDLHAGNVLAAEREPWLVIDPKPYVGDPAYDATQHLLNCVERLHADPAGLANRMADLLAVDPVRLRRWLFARCVQESPGDPPLADVARRLPLD